MKFFVVDLKYVRPLEEVDALAEGHIAFLNEQYAQNNFIVSGPKVPREGGVIIAKMASREALNEALALDPFKQAGVAEYTVTEFTARMYTDALKRVVEPN